jgi:DNA-binding transcriptional LysR family regulator
LAVAQRGGLREAANALGVTQATVSRRVQALEADLGIPLFERHREGHRLTAAGSELFPDVRAVETAALRVEKRSLGLLGGLTETVRIEAGETAAALLVRGLQKLESGPSVELLVTGISSQTSGRTPEVLVRHGLPEKARGITRRVGSISCAVYGAPSFADDRTLPLADTDLLTLPWLGFVEEQEHYATMQWLRALMKGRPPAARLMNADLMAVAAAAGLGIAVLPCFLGNANASLVRLSALIEILRADYWIVAHPDLSGTRAVRAVMDWVATCFRAQEQATG